ncbi:MAG: lactonase family protein [Candidatus Brocadiae bacterium]|nr:lactonase family protein [Candidatus Brocadiia bacterium]
MSMARLALLLLAVLAVPACGEKPTPGNTIAVYVGTSPGSGSVGIYRFDLDRTTGAVSSPELAARATNPSFLAIHPGGRFLYAVAETGESGGKKTGAVVAFAIGEEGNLTEINRQSSEGAGPCHLVVDKAGKNVLVANYGGGSVACLPIQPDGSLSPASSTRQHTGSSVDPKRQRAPHAHSINLDAADRFAFAADLGIDRILIYRFDADKGLLTPNDPPAGVVAPGSGPRHFTFHPTGAFAYVVNELALTVTAFAYDAEKGALTEVQTITTLPVEKQAGFSTAEIVCSQDGKFVYASNRGHDTIAIFSVDGATGRLAPVGHESTQGKTPRNFAIDPSGTFLLAENQGSGTIVVFRRDAGTGRLTATGHVAKVGSPVCVRFLDPAK